MRDLGYDMLIWIQSWSWWVAVLYQVKIVLYTEPNNFYAPHCQVTLTLCYFSHGTLSRWLWSTYWWNGTPCNEESVPLSHKIRSERKYARTMNFFSAPVVLVVFSFFAFSYYSFSFGLVAQSWEQRWSNPKVMGSFPTTAIVFFCLCVGPPP